MKWLYAAYRKGAFKLPDGLSQEDFVSAVMVETLGFEEIYTLFAPLYEESHHRGEKVPIGLVGANFNQHRMEVHAVWLPWASRRNILEASLKFLNFMRARHLVLIFVRKETRHFFEHLCRYGVLRNVGVIDDYWAGASAWVFHTRGYRAEP